MKKLFLSAAILALITPAAMADGLLPPKEPQAIEITMPDGSKQLGFIKEGKFIPISAAAPITPVLPAVQTVAPPPPLTPNPEQLTAGLRLDQHQTQVQDSTQKIQQDIKTNNRSVTKREHDGVDAVNTYGRLLIDGIRMFGNMRR